MSGPVQHLCAFGECAGQASHCFTAPGIAGARNGPHVWTCTAHQEHGPLLLQAKIDAGNRERTAALTAAAHRREGKLL